MDDEFNDLRFAVVDVEGNGQQPPEIVEIAVAQLDGLVRAGELVAWLVKPERPIAPIVTRKVHGISNADVAEAPPWSAIVHDVSAALAGRIPVAHNAHVEYDVLRRHIPGWEPETVLDTLRLARAVWPGLGTYNLDHLLDHAGIVLGDTPGQRHRAGFDAQATALLFLTLAKGVRTREELLAAASLPGLNPAGEQGVLW